MLACTRPESFPLQPACVVLRFRPETSDGPRSVPDRMPDPAGFETFAGYPEDAARLTRAAQAFLLRIGS